MSVKYFLSILFLCYFCFSTDVSSCTKISSSGNYLLSRDLIGAIQTNIPSKTACLYITASDVILDCGGHSITNNGTSNAAGILIDQASSVTIKNCYIYDYVYGLFAQSSTNNKFSRITTEKNDYGFYFLSATDSSISSNSVSKNKVGYRFESSSRNSLTSNSANENDIGFSFISSSNSNQLSSNNRATKNQISGIELISSSQNTIKDTYLSENVYGVLLNSSSTNYFSTNRFYENQVAIYLYGSKAEINSDIYSSSKNADIIFYSSAPNPSSISATNIMLDNNEPETSVQLSLSDSSTNNYAIKWSDPSSNAPPQNFLIYPHSSIEISSKDTFSINQITFDWSKFNLSSFDERNFYSAIYDGEWALTGSDVDHFSHKVTIDHVRFPGIYAIIQKLPPPKTLNVYYLLGCNKTTITIKDNDGKFVTDAAVKFETPDKIYSLYTNEKGEAVFPICGKQFTASASKDEYVGNSLSPLQVACSCNQCTLDKDCPDYQKCSNLKCTNLYCPNATVYAHQCVQCANDYDCTDGLICKSNKCINVDVECVSDDDCGQSKSCISNICVQKIPKCPDDFSCSEGQRCDAGNCVDATHSIYSIGAPLLINVGEKIPIYFRKNGTACNNCTIEISGPDTELITKADENGQYLFSENLAGTYTISILENELAVSKITMNVILSPTPKDQSPLSSYLVYLWPILLLSVIIFAILLIYFYFKSKKKG